MDRRWMSADRLNEQYANGVEEFIRFACAGNDNAFIRCPCVRCCCVNRMKADEVKDHLFIHGIDKGYRRWIWHGETELSAMSCNYQENDGLSPPHYVGFDDQMQDMMHDVVEDNFVERPHILDSLLGDAEKPLYPGCTKFTRLSAVLRLFNLKAGNGWSDKSFTCLLELLKDMLPDGNELPDRTYEAKKILCPMGMDYKKIHACPNDCILYRKEYKSLDECPKCGASRYKLKKMNGVTGTTGAPAKVLWYLPIIPRFKRMFANARDAKNLTWHANRVMHDGKLRHVADSPQWKTVDSLFPQFGTEARNLRLGLCTDGMNPHGNLSSKHSTWPVLLVIYNLPPWFCMKRKYVMLSLLISGPKQPGNDIDVFLAPLIDDLRLMWDEGVTVFDAYRRESFQLHALLFCTINDFPAYGNLSGYSVKGHKACPICENNTSFCQLKHGKKTVYLSHRKFLPRSHHYRRQRKAFNGSPEDGKAPIPLTGEQVYERVKEIEVSFGKPHSHGSDKSTPWKKRSIFFDLPYWQHLFVRHNLDVMHVEKNICDSLIGTLLNVPGKTKDGVKARLDLVDMAIRPGLAPEKRGQRTYLPPACHTLSKKEKTSFCQCLQDIKVPQGYSSNIRSLVSMKDLKLVGLKSHDCHALMQQLLPVAIRSILPKHVRQAISRLCFFFDAICAKVIDPENLDDLQREVVVTLCQLEMYFPPSFFDIMVHLVVHLVREIKLCGPVYLRWMYPFERYMKILKGYVRNRHRPEGCIVEGYIAEEVVEFCSDYMSNAAAIGVPRSRHEGRIAGKGTLGTRVVSISRDLWVQAHFYVLHNTEEVEPYLEEHMTLTREQNYGKNDTWVQGEHNRSFITWFQNRVQLQLAQSPNDVSETVRWLAHGPRMEVLSYRGYDINGFAFYTKEQDDRSTMQNSGVTLVAQQMHVSSSKDRNPIYAKMSYYGVIEDIWELDYITFREPVFRCKWVDYNNGIRIDELGFTLVDLNREGRHKGEPFILASQAKQVFYISDPADKKWSVVLRGKKQVVGDGDEEDMTNDIDDTPPFSSRLPPININDEGNLEASYVRDDHGEGLWVEDERK